MEALEARQMLAGDAREYMITTLDDVAVAGTTSDSLWSLREALNHSALDGWEEHDTIYFNQSLFSGAQASIDLDSSLGPLVVNSFVNILGPGADKLEIDAGGASRVINVAAYASTTISGLTITGGHTDYGGGILNYSDLTLDGVVVAGNQASYAGGGVYSANGFGSIASLHLVDTTIDNNRAQHGAGLYVSLAYGALVIDSSTISNNQPYDPTVYSAGGGIAIAGSATGSVYIGNSTFSGNKAMYSGGIRLHNNNAPTTIENSTIAYNRGNESGGLQRLATSAAPTVHNTIISENTDYAGVTPKDVLGALNTSSSYNLIGRGGSGGLANNVNSNIILSGSATARLAPLDFYGGPTKTHALQIGSMAIDRGSNTIAAGLDQRGESRIYELPNFGYLNRSDIGAFEAHDGLTLTVTTLEDRNSANAMTADLSLREALQKAALLAGADKVVFDERLYASGPAVITLTYDGDGAGVPDPLNVNGVWIAGPGADLLTISGGNRTRVMNNTGYYATIIEGVTITDGYATSGAGIYQNWFGNLTLKSTRVTGNTATYSGGGIYSYYGNLRIENSEISENTAGAYGGGIRHFSYYDGVSLNILNTTISGNRAEMSGGGVSTSLRYGYGYGGQHKIVNSTITGNAAPIGGGVYSYQYSTYYSSQQLNVHNSIVAGNTTLDGAAATDVEGMYFHPASSNNLIGPGGDSGLSGNGNVFLTSGQSPLLAPLAYNGGSTRTHALLPGSLAIDGGSNPQAAGAGLAVDQRGRNRVVSFAGPNYEAVDIGAYEHGLIVSTTSDVVDGNYSTGNLSLREAISLAALIPGPNEIEIAPTLAGGTITLASSNGTLVIDSDVEIMGPGAGLLSIHGGGHSRVLTISDSKVTISGVTITGGSPTNELYTAGGIAASNADLTLNRVTITGNSSIDGVGGIFAAGGSLMLNDSTVDGNFSDHYGGIKAANTALTLRGSTISNNTGGIFEGGISFSGSEPLSIVNSTISGNSGFEVGGISITGSGALEILNSTIANNEQTHWYEASHYSGGVRVSGAPAKLTVHNTIIAGNRLSDGSASDVTLWQSGRIDSRSSNNLIGYDPDGRFSSSRGNVISVGLPLDARLAPLGDYGGATFTHALLPGSPAIDAGNQSISGFDELFDQRGAAHPRSVGAQMDIGALESAFVSSDVYVLLDAAGTLHVGNAASQFDEVIIGTTLVGMNRMVTINGAATKVRASGVLGIDIRGGNHAERIDLSQVNAIDFPNLVDGAVFVDAAGGHDVVVGSHVADVIHAGEGDDKIFGRLGDDELHGQGGNDVLFADEGADIADGGEGDDLIYGGAGNDDELRGGAGNDIIYGGAGDDSGIRGGDGHDELYGDDGDDSLYGEEGDDVLDAGLGNNFVQGGAGDDRYVVGNEALFLGGAATRVDAITDSSGHDTIDLSSWKQYSGSYGAGVDLNDDYVNAVDPGGYIILTSLNQSGVESLIGTSFNDTLILGSYTAGSVDGLSGDDFIYGSAEDDSLQGGEGDDQIFGSLGSDVLRGGAGDDTLYSGGNSGADHLFGDGGNDIYHATVFSTTTHFYEGAGNDEYRFGGGQLGHVTIQPDPESAADGVDTLNFQSKGTGVAVSLASDEVQQVASGANSLSLTIAGSSSEAGAALIENVIGSPFDDTITGDSRNNILRGGAGRDEIDGGGGDDVILGEDGFDVLEAIDQADSTGFLAIPAGKWFASNNGGGFNGGQLYAEGSATTTAITQWMFQNLAAGQYEVYVTWQADPADLAAGASASIGASNATFYVGGTTRQVNQRQQPQGEVIGGVAWQKLDGLFAANSNGQLGIALSDAANGRVYADAIRIVKHNAAPVITPIGDRTVPAGSSLITGITATDDGGAGNVTLSLAGDVPTGLTLIPNGPGAAILYWPASAQRPQGQFPVTILATDAQDPSKTSAETILITVGNLPTAPGSITLNLQSPSGAFSNGVYTVAEGQSLVIDVSSLGAGVTYSVGPDAPEGAGFSDSANPNRFIWTPSESQDSDTPYEITLRATKDGNPPLRVTTTISVKVVEANAAPTLGPISLLYDTRDPATVGGDADRRTINPIIVGTVSNDGSVDEVEVEIDYNYQAAQGFQRNATAIVTMSDVDPSQGSFLAKPSSFHFPTNSGGNPLAMTVAVRAREWRGDAGGGQPGYIYSAHQLLTITPDLGEDTAPVVSVALQHNSGTAQNPESADPTLIGSVANVDGPVADLTVRIYNLDPGTNPAAESIAVVRTDDLGKFAWTQPGLVEIDQLETPPADGEVNVNLWFVAEEETAFGVFSSLLTEYSYKFLVNQPPTIISLALQQDTGTSSTDGITSNTTIVGQVAHADGSVAGITIEFDDDHNGVVDGTAVTDEAGRFTYIATNASRVLNDLGRLNARAVEWDEYQQITLRSPWLVENAVSGPTPLKVMFDPTANAAPGITLLQPLYPNGGNPLSDPTVWGLVVNDNGYRNVAVEFSTAPVNPVTGNFDPEHVLGLAYTDDDGRFEFTPMGLTAGAPQTIYARAIEWDPQQEQGSEFLSNEILAQITFTLSANPLTVSSFSGIQLAFDTGTSNTDHLTSDPTIKGTVTYNGDYSNVVVEFDHNGDGIVDGTATPDVNGAFTYTPAGLANLTATTIQARVRVPDFGVRPDDFDTDALITSGWYLQGYNAENQENPWDQEVLDDWFDDVFDASGNGFAGDWYNSSFERDWSTLFSDATTPWASTSFTLNLGENLAPSVLALVLSDPATPQINPGIVGLISNDGKKEGLVVEFYLNGSATPDGRAVTNAVGIFEYTLKNHVIGGNAIVVKIIEPTYGGGAPTETTTAPFTVSIDANPLLEVSELLLKSGTIAADSQLEALDPTLIGSVKAIGGAGALVVQFDYNGDGLPDAFTRTDGLGRFEFLPEGLSLDSSYMTTVRAQVVEELEDEETGLVYRTLSPWTSLTWRVVSNAAPTIAQFELERDTLSGFGASWGAGVIPVDRITSDPTLVGRVANDNGAGLMLVEFDHDEDGVVDGTTLTDSRGVFRYVPEGLTAGSWNIRARVSEYDPVSKLQLTSPWAKITHTGDPAATSPFYGFTLVDAVAASGVTLVHAGYVDNGATSDPTLTGVVSDSESSAKSTVNFYLLLAGNERRLIGSTQTRADGSFDYLPTGLPFGNVQIVAEVRKLNYATGAELITQSPAVSFEFAETYTGITANQIYSNPYDPVLSGRISVDADIHAQFVEVDVHGDGIIDAIVPVEKFQQGNANPEFRFTYRTQITSTPDPVEIRFRAAGFDSRPVGQGQPAKGYVFGPWLTQSFDFDFNEPTVSATPPDADSDEPTLTGYVNAAYIYEAAAAPIVEIDLDGDGVVDDSVATTGASNEFTYRLRDVGHGSVTVWARATRYETIPGGNDTDKTITVPGQWQAITFDLNDPAPGVQGLDLANETGATTPDHTTDPTITGTVVSQVGGEVGGLTIEVDHDGDGVADATTITEDDGTFRYTPRNLPLGEATLRVRAVDPYAASGHLAGQWASITFTLVAFTSSVTELTLLDDEDAGSGFASSDPEFIGSAERHASVISLAIEFDHNNDGVADGSTTADLQGNFHYRPSNLSYGENPIRARAVAVSATGQTTGAWSGTPLVVDFISTESPVVSDISAPDAATGRITGRLTLGGYGAAGTIEVAVVGPGGRVVNGAVNTDANGFFSFTPKNLRTGSVQLEVRAVYRHPTSANPINGQWQALPEFNYSPGPTPVGPLTFSEYRLAYNTGASTTDQITADPTIVGQLSSGASLVSVDFSHNGVTVVANSSVRGDGSFEYRPVGLTEGAPATIYVRYRVWDPVSGTESVGSWTTAPPVSFTLDSNANVPAAIMGLAPQTTMGLSGGLPLTASPTFTGQVINDGDPAGITVYFDHDGDGLYDGSTVTRQDGKFVYRAAGLEPSSAVQSISAYVVERSYTGAERPASAPTTLTFILQPAPQIATLQYAPTAGTAGQIQGSVTTSTGTVSAHIEYIVFGNYDHAPPAPMSLANFVPNAPLMTASVATGGSFSIDLAQFELALGPASVVMRVVDDANGAVGAWESLNFNVAPATVAALAINDFQLVDSNSGSASNPTASGVVGSGGAGAFAVVEIVVRDLYAATERTYRTTADASGRFQFTPEDMNVGTSYEYEARHVPFDVALGIELEPGAASLLNFYLVNFNSGTIIDFGPKSTATPLIDPTVKGYLQSPGRIAGVRIEFDTNGNAEDVEGFAYTDATGYFEYTPYDIAAGQQKTIRARAVEWDGIAQEYVAGDFTQATTSITLSQAGPTDPTLDDDFKGDEDAVSHANSGARDGVTSLLASLGGGAGGVIDVGVGTVQIHHQAQADSIGSGGASGTDFVFTAGGEPQTGTTNISGQTIPSSFQTDQGGDLDGTYSYYSNITKNGNTVTVHIAYTVNFSSYHQDSTFPGDDANYRSELEMSGVYTFVYIASATYTSGGVLVSGSHDLTETLNFDYRREYESLFAGGEANGGDASQSSQTTAGDYSYVYEEDGSFGATSSSQTFSYHEVVRTESWYDRSGGSTTASGGSFSTSRYSDSEHTIYARTSDHSGTIIVSAGAQTIGGTLTVSAVGDRTTDHAESSTYVTQYEGASRDSGGLTRSSSSQFHGTFSGTTNYVTGQSTSSTYSYSDSFNANGQETGTGSSSSIATGYSHSENWSYNVGASLNSSLSISGSATADFTGDQVHRTSSMSVSHSGSADSSGRSSGTVNYSRTSGDTTETGNSSGQLSFDVSAAVNDNATLTSVDGVQSASAHGSLSFSSDVDELVSSTSIVTSADHDSRSSTQRRLSGGASGSGSYHGTSSPAGSATTGSYSHTSSVSALTASQVAGTQTIDGERGAFRANETVDFTFAASSAGVFSFRNTPTESHYFENGGFSTRGSANTTSSSYEEIVGEVDGYALTKSRASSNSFIGGVYTDADGVSQVSGTFGNSSQGSSETITSVSGSTATDTSQSSFTSSANTGARSNQSVQGIFQDAGGNRTETGTGFSSRTAYATTAGRSTNRNWDANGSSTSTEASTSKSQLSQNGNTVYQTENGVIISELTNSRASSSTRGSGSSSSRSIFSSSSPVDFSVTVEGGSGSYRNSESGNANETYILGVDGFDRTTNTSGSYSSSSRTSGFSKTISGERYGDSGSTTIVATSGSTSGSRNGGGSGVIRANHDGQRSQDDFQDRSESSYSSSSATESASYTPTTATSSIITFDAAGSSTTNSQGSNVYGPSSFSSSATYEGTSRTTSKAQSKSNSFSELPGSGRHSWTESAAKLNTSAETTLAGASTSGSNGSTFAGSSSSKQSESGATRSVDGSFDSSAGYNRSVITTGGTRSANENSSSKFAMVNGELTAASADTSGDARETAFMALDQTSRSVTHYEDGMSGSRLDKHSLTTNAFSTNYGSGRNSRTESRTFDESSVDEMFSRYAGPYGTVVITDATVYETHDRTTISNDEGRAALTITNDRLRETRSVRENLDEGPYEGGKVYSYWHQIQSEPTFWDLNYGYAYNVWGNDWVSKDTTRFTSDYSSRHYVDDAGLVRGGSLSASSKEITERTVRGGTDNPAISVSGGMEAGWIYNKYASTFNSSVGSTTTKRENGSYWDERQSNGAVRRQAQGHASESSEGYARFSGSWNSEEKVWDHEDRIIIDATAGQEMQSDYSSKRQVESSYGPSGSRTEVKENSSKDSGQGSGKSNFKSTSYAYGETHTSTERREYSDKFSRSIPTEGKPSGRWAHDGYTDKSWLDPSRTDDSEISRYGWTSGDINVNGAEREKEKPVVSEGSSGSPMTGPGGNRFSGMSDAEFDAYVESMPEDIFAFNAAMAAFSDAEEAEFRARLQAREKPGETQYESPAGAFFEELSLGLIDLGADETPVVGQGKAISEVVTGKNWRGEDLGVWGRVGSGLSLIPGAGLVKKSAEGLGEIARGVGRLVDGLTGGGKRADDLIDGAFEGTKRAPTGSAVDDVFDPATKQLRVIQDYCFAPETLVATPVGPRPISEIRKGDTVFAFDHRSGEWRAREVSIRHDSVYEGPLVTIKTDSGIVRSTVYHPFWVLNGRDLIERSRPRELSDREDEDGLLPGRWVNSHELRPGDVLISRDGKQRFVLRIEQDFVSGFPVCNLTIDNDHTYAVGDDALLVHNTGSCEALRGKLQGTLDRIAKGQSFPHRNDGTVFRNREGLLPSKPEGYYKEYVHPTPGVTGPGAQRVVMGLNGEIYYTPDHYKTFIQLQ